MEVVEMSYEVRVRQDFQHARVTVAGREFLKRAWMMVAETEMCDEILHSPLLEVVGGGEGVRATDAARELAAEHDVALGEVQGSGEGGRVLVGDVWEVIDVVG
jgi:pyruvate/2-oxoglutarate dehydrogenase complex dihydrolipoamide acyltransferase (E2) component